jgi:hypothetical protein
MSNSNHSNAKERAMKYSMEYGNSSERFGHKDYYAAKKSGASDADILRQLDANPDTLYSGNAKGSGGLYDQIASGALSGKEGGSNTNTQKNIGNTTQTVTQDNDQTSSIKGDNNYVNQNQDNSVRNYGGDSRVFNYQSSGNPSKDTPASAATMAGYYAPKDSHAANAARIDRQATQNRDLQKAYQNTDYIAQGAISRAKQNSYSDPAALDKRIGQRERYNNAKSDVMRSQLFGDMGNFATASWNDAKSPEKVESPDYEKMYKKYSKF